MAQPNASDVYVSSLLTNISIAYMQNANDFIADKVFPMINVDKQTGKFALLTKDDWFLDQAQERAPATESVGSGYRIDNTGTYDCTEYAIHKDIPDQVRANAAAPYNVDKEATMFITQRMLMRREIDFAEKFLTTSVWGKDYTGVAGTPSTNQFKQWNNELSSDPIGDIATGKQYIKSITGQEANVLVLSREVFDVLKRHPDIIDRIKYTGRDVPTTVLMASLFEVEKVLVSNAVKNTAAERGTFAGSFIMSKSAMLCFAAPTPGILTPSAGYTFAWTGMGGAGISISNIRMPLKKADRIEGSFTFDHKVTASDLGVFFTSAVA